MSVDLNTKSPTKKSGKPKRKLKIKITAPFRMVYEGEASDITSEGQYGKGNVLQGDHNILGIIDPCTLVINAPDGEKRITVTGGFLHVQGDNVTIYLDS